MRIAVLNVELGLRKGGRLHDTTQHVARRNPNLQVLGLAANGAQCERLAEHQSLLMCLVEQVHLEGPSGAPDHAVVLRGALGGGEDGIAQGRANHITILRRDSCES